MQITDLAPDIDRRFGALARLYGNDGAARIRSAHIIIVGIGGVGSWAAEAAARSGVARLTLVDLDHVAESNINRQVHAVTPTIGQSKVLAMGNRIALIHPGCVVDCIEDLSMLRIGQLYLLVSSQRMFLPTLFQSLMLATTFPQSMQWRHGH